jgi:hypothetical protein
MTSGPVVDPEALVEWIADRHEIDSAVVSRVLEIEYEFMVGVGLVSEQLIGADAFEVEIEARHGWKWQFYDPSELAPEPAFVDAERIARDAERLADIPFETALEILSAEIDYLEAQGLI